MLVPGYINPDSVKALAKLSGMDPTDAKYKRPGDSPRSRKAATGKSTMAGGAMQSVAGGTYGSTIGESALNNN